MGKDLVPVTQSVIYVDFGSHRQKIFFRKFLARKFHKIFQKSKIFV